MDENTLLTIARLYYSGSAFFAIGSFGLVVLQGVRFSIWKEKQKLFSGMQAAHNEVTPAMMSEPLAPVYAFDVSNGVFSGWRPPRIPPTILAEDRARRLLEMLRSGVKYSRENLTPLSRCISNPDFWRLSAYWRSPEQGIIRYSIPGNPQSGYEYTERGRAYFSPAP